MKYVLVSALLLIANCSSPFNILQYLGSAITDKYLADSPCLDKLKSMLPPNMSDPVVLALLMDSSHNINDLGDYRGCIATNGSRYILMKNSISNDQPSFFTIALCLPAECKPSDFTPLKPSIFSFLQKMMTENGIDLNNPNFNFTQDSIQFLDAKEESELNTTITTGTIVTYSILFVLLMAVVIATIIDYQVKPSPQNNDSMFMSFSAIRSMKSLLGNTNPVDQNLNILNGVRVISIIWVILGHAYGLVMTIIAPNTSDITYQAKYPKWFAMVTGATVSVDTFFALSGFLCALNSVKIFEKPENRTAINVLKGIVMRYIRLTPILIISILLQTFVFSRLFGGPIHNFWSGPVAQCKGYYYWNLLYINNLFKEANSCAGWTWYICCDFQFYIFSFLITIPFSIKKAYGFVVVGITAIASTVLQAVVISVYDLSSSNIRNGGNYADIYYNKPYTRINTYLLGILFAWIYVSYKYKEKHGVAAFNKITDQLINNKPLRYSVYTVGAGLTTAAVFLQHLIDYYCNSVKIYQNVFFIIISRPAFIFGLFMIILPLMLGRGKQLSAFLGAPFMSPLSKLTYGVYMYHIILLSTEAYTTHSYIFFSNINAFMWVFHEYIFSLLMSLLSAILIEAPFIRIEKALISRGTAAKAITTYKPVDVKEVKE